MYLIFIFWLSEAIYKFSIDNENIKEYKSPFVSIIIAARNEEKNIKDVLQAILNQTYNKKLYEVKYEDMFLILWNQNLCEYFLCISNQCDHMPKILVIILHKHSYFLKLYI